MAADVGDAGRQADVRPGDRRRSVTTEAALLMADFLVEGARTLVFTKSRAGAELVALRAQTELARVGRPDLGARVAAYRAGYLAADRRRIELGALAMATFCISPPDSWFTFLMAKEDRDIFSMIPCTRWISSWVMSHLM